MLRPRALPAEPGMQPTASELQDAADGSLSRINPVTTRATGAYAAPLTDGTKPPPPNRRRKNARARRRTSAGTKTLAPTPTGWDKIERTGGARPARAALNGRLAATLRKASTAEPRKVEHHPAAVKSAPTFKKGCNTALPA